ncbi:tannase/feruloyl esterase family alpha/beta hydrolase [Herbaspirillum frisingense]|uniref:tannase/feruloyl esterase family alpha/beta hydrolase n=1 Tax=Herbaspirillum frisingense TaxID=92645 RepID=UPI0039AF7240
MEFTTIWPARTVAAALAFVLLDVVHAAQPVAAPHLRAPTSAMGTETDCTALSGPIGGGVVLNATTIPEKSDMPAYCRVTGTIAPSLNFEIRFPKTWNGKLYYGGGGGYNGFVPPPVAAPLRQGYVEVASDSGHQGDGMSAAFVLNDERAARLFGSEAVPEVMSIALKVVAKAYGMPPVRSYFEGYSTGGREGLMAVQRNPELFDGVIARAPAFNWVGFNGAFHRIAQALSAPGAEFKAAKIALLARHVRQACDKLDGVVDGIVANPAACTARRVNVAALRCSSGKDAGEHCLSDAQIAVVTQWITDVKFQGSNTYVAKGFNLTGNEDDPMNFGVWVSGNGDLKVAGQYVMQDTAVKYYLAKDETADSIAYGPWDKKPAALDAMATLNDATDPDIRPFIGHGGKLIVWQGGADAALSVNSTIDYMKQMRQVVGGENADHSTRFYVAPGVNHCEGGVGPDHTDLLSVLDNWIANGAEPGTLIARKLDESGRVVRALPLCQYPQYPRYTGPRHDTAAIRSASNYVCTNP